MTVPVAMIAAVARNRVIGAAGGIPWRIPSDMEFFRRTTLGKPIVMGRKQFETVGKPLPGRTNIVVTRQETFHPNSVTVCSTLEAALAEAQLVAAREGAAEVMVIGGGEIYAQTMPLADRLYITHVDLAPEGDTLFPEISDAEWEVLEELPTEPDPRDAAPYRIRLYGRRAPGFR